ncbi:NKAP family protein CG6066-like [Oppia nitens]|uniref:NKAP family protein CG6066-like n=1 Tax=Oppia nitens TaxID=1686743 RepID=UPI0023DB67E8|nr:NKAP family protein CG6066-like [Oppia nitens]
MSRHSPIRDTDRHHYHSYDSESHRHRRRREPSPDYHKNHNSDKYRHKYNDNHINEDFWTTRRLKRESIGESGVISVWGHLSSRHEDIDDSDMSTDGKVVGKRRSVSTSESDSTDGLKDKKNKKHKKSSKKSKKDKTSHKKHKHRKSRNKERKRSNSRDRYKKDKNVITNEYNRYNNEEEEKFIKELNEKKKRMEMDEEEDDMVGPQPKSAVQLNQKDFGRALLPGEGAAMAAFIAEGKRIPRRGEIGLTSEEIDSFENVGYVMSGSRHRRMEAVRLRKENQIYSADEKRALALFNKEERTIRETKILSQFKDMIRAKQEEHQTKH